MTGRVTRGSLPSGPLGAQLTWLEQQVHRLWDDTDKERNARREAEQALERHLADQREELLGSIREAAIGELRKEALGLLLVTVGTGNIASIVPLVPGTTARRRCPSGWSPASDTQYTIWGWPRCATMTSSTFPFQIRWRARRSVTYRWTSMKARV
ncbi:hypothetical protein [Streptomyces sp. NPDC002851]